ncbi:hypothetical protein MHZ95_00780 [Sporosarcina sp. ACRSM]|uniref:hypothetical protein n=1 Tax=Sporosarcina sp. ACRSM TaxID=2918216 RepID=UPI001EF71673|nr:hypothetical protein [Sporosarcina sp. ACRSM]MCG7333804.1 hypothetical protein [Sporosarcina sp. ACRSM]
MRWFLAIPFLFLGAFLFSLIIDQMGNIGHIIMKLLGFGCIYMGALIVKGKRGDKAIEKRANN